MQDFKSREKERFCGLLACYVCKDCDNCLENYDRHNAECKNAFEKAENFHDNFLGEFADYISQLD